MSDWTEEDEKKAVDFYVQEHMKIYDEEHPGASNADRKKEEAKQRMEAKVIMADAKKKKHDIKNSPEIAEAMIKDARGDWTEWQLKNIDYYVWEQIALYGREHPEATVEELKKIGLAYRQQAKIKMLDPNSEEARKIDARREKNRMLALEGKSRLIPGAKVEAISYEQLQQAQGRSNQ